jgi:hypothetical protein
MGVLVEALLLLIAPLDRDSGVTDCGVTTKYAAAVSIKWLS